MATRWGFKLVKAGGQYELAQPVITAVLIIFPTGSLHSQEPLVMISTAIRHVIYWGVIGFLMCDGVWRLFR